MSAWFWWVVLFLSGAVCMWAAVEALAWAWERWFGEVD